MVPTSSFRAPCTSRKALGTEARGTVRKSLPEERKGNEDLDPCIIFERLWSQGPDYLYVQLLIRIGCDRIDAVDYGQTLVVPFNQFGRFEYPVYTGLMRQGFDMKVADEMLEANAWMHLYAAKLIVNPKHGVSLDVLNARTQYGNRNFSTDPHGTKAYCIQDTAKAQREKREERVSIIGRGSMIGERDDKVWKGRKPKNIKELGEWFKRNGEEPEPEAIEDDADLYPDDSSTSSNIGKVYLVSDSKKRRMI
jgi:hypothetical protein